MPYFRSDEGLTLETSAFQSLYGGQFTLSLSLPSSIRSDEGLTLETSAFQSLYGGQFTLSTPLINQIFVYHRRSTTVSIETNPLY